MPDDLARSRQIQGDSCSLHVDDVMISGPRDDPEFKRSDG